VDGAQAGQQDAEAVHPVTERIKSAAHGSPDM